MGHAGKKADGNREEKKDKNDKEGMFFVGWKETRGGTQKARVRQVENSGKTKRTPERVRFRL